MPFHALFKMRGTWLPFLQMGFSLLLLVSTLRTAPKDDWDPITPEETASKAALNEPDAAAEVLFWRIDVDENNGPGSSLTKEYIRFKIYQPEKAENALSLTIYDSSFSGSGEEDTALSARVIKPDGTVKVFGKDAVRDRKVFQSGNANTVLNRIFGYGSAPKVKQKVLALGGIEPGSIVEYKRTTSLNYVRFYEQRYMLQRPHFPARRVNYTWKPAKDYNYNQRFFLLNGAIGNASSEQNDDHDLIQVHATNVPSLQSEPFSGKVTDVALTAVCSVYPASGYNQNRSGNTPTVYNIVTEKTGPWSGIATSAYLKETDCSDPTSRVKKLALKLTAETPTSLEKARIIHRYAQSLALEFNQVPFRKRKNEESNSEDIKSLDDVLDYAKNPAITGGSQEEYLWLALAMYRAIGLECRAVMLPTYPAIRFERRLVMKTSLLRAAAQVKIDGQWTFSVPYTDPPLPLGLLPWYCEGQEGLIAQPQKQEFVETPTAPSTTSLLANGGVFTLSPEGALTGTAKRKYSGHHAEQIRDKFRKQKDPKEIKRKLTDLLNDEFTSVTGGSASETNEEESTAKTSAHRAVTITAITGMEDNGDIEVTYQLNLPHYATIINERLIIRPSLFRLNLSTPFPSSTRTHPVRFPFAWQELDAVTLKLPANYQPEMGEPPASATTPSLHYRTQVQYDAAKHALRLRREFNCGVTFVPVTAYPALKAWFDEMDRADQYDVILVKRAVAPAATNEEKTTPAASQATP